jgi:hypothetical protein
MDGSGHGLRSTAAAIPANPIASNAEPMISIYLTAETSPTILAGHGNAGLVVRQDIR